MSIGMRGRHGQMAIIDGDMMEVRSIIRIGKSSEAFTLPKLWLEFMRRGGELKGIGIRTNGNTLILKPYYGEGHVQKEGQS